MSDTTTTPSSSNNLTSELKFSIDPHAVLSQMQRTPCVKCQKTFKYFCYNCQAPLNTSSSTLPQFTLPLKTIIIQHKNERKGKSTAIHAKILCPQSVEICEYPNIPQELVDHASNAVLLYPSADAITVEEVIRRNSFYQKNFVGEIVTGGETDKNLEPQQQEIKYVVFIDSTWQQSKSIFRDERLSKLTRCKIMSQKTKFWRHQQHGEEFLATIEAIYYFFKEYQIEINKLKNLKAKAQNQLEASAVSLYDGEFDDLLFFYAFQYDLIQRHYKEHPDLKFTEKKGENYIKYDEAKDKNNKRQATEQQPSSSGEVVDDTQSPNKKIKL